MPLTSLAILIVVFFLTTIVGVVTGSNSLITVPVMFQFGIDEKVAVATNMFGLTFMAIGATIPFLRQGSIDARKLSPLILVTIVGSALGAVLVGLITNQAIKIIVSVAMIVVVVFTLLRRNGKTTNDGGTARPITISWFVLLLTFLLAIYGGLYSGGYVTVLTTVFIAFAGMTYTGSIAATKLINVFSSGIATLVFMWQRLVDYKLGIILAVTMFVGAYVGAHYATKLNEIWLRRIFLATVFLLAIKTLSDLI
ncbi:MAG TPA: sulfite exporter TauE/SafE family protein [Pyrinomonadaceae bacterium]|nr:sulfite exporter TauE/SafE family protein [Pyrinomonadaceae bacterium]